MLGKLEFDSIKRLRNGKNRKTSLRRSEMNDEQAKRRMVIREKQGKQRGK